MTKFEDDAVEQISRAINVIQVDEEEVGRRLANIHPTLQQGFMRIVVGFLQEMAAKDYVDARNEYARDLAKLLLKDVNEGEMYLPLI